MNVANWLRQPTTITGMATIATALVAGGVQLAMHDPAASATFGAVAFAAVHLLVNDNTAATDAQTLVGDLVAHKPREALIVDTARAAGDVVIARAETPATPKASGG